MGRRMGRIARDGRGARGSGVGLSTCLPAYLPACLLGGGDDVGLRRRRIIKWGRRDKKRGWRKEKQRRMRRRMERRKDENKSRDQ